MERIIPEIKRWFAEKREHFEVFARNDTRLESWFKGELLVLLERLKSEGVIDNFEREPNVQTNLGRKQIDFSVRINGEEHLCELKAACISRAKGTPRDIKFYFRKDDVGLMKDFLKLDRIAGERKWVLAFFYPKPSVADWSYIASSLQEDNRRCVTKLEDYPKYFFVALWDVSS